MTRRVPFPFVPVPAAAWQPLGRPLTLPERLVLGVLFGRWARGEDAIRISAAELVADTELDRRTVQRTIAGLLAGGLLERRETGGGRGRRAVYVLAERAAHDRRLNRGQGAEHAPDGAARKGGTAPRYRAEKGRHDPPRKGGKPPGKRAAQDRPDHKREITRTRAREERAPAPCSAATVGSPATGALRGRPPVVHEGDTWADDIEPAEELARVIPLRPTDDRARESAQEDHAMPNRTTEPPEDATADELPTEPAAESEPADDGRAESAPRNPEAAAKLRALFERKRAST